MTQDPAGELVYVYAVAPAGPALDDALARAGASGMAGGPVRTVTEGPLGALVCDVPVELFGEDALTAQLNDLAALEKLAREHHGTVAALSGAVTVLPLRLATLYADDAGVRRMLRQGAEFLTARLARLAGTMEWGVKVYADLTAVDPAGPATPDGPGAASSAPGTAGAGRAYLRQRLDRREALRRAYADAEILVGRVMERAGEFAVDRAWHRPQQGALAPTTGENIANLAFLVPFERAEAFRAAMDAFDGVRPGTRVEVTGPWAPYSFATAAPESVPEPAAEGRTADHPPVRDRPANGEARA